MLGAIGHRLKRERRRRSTGPVLGSGSTVPAVVDRQLRLFVVSMLLVSVPTLAVNYYTQPPAVSSPAPEWADGYAEQFDAAAAEYNRRADALWDVQVWGLDLRRAYAVLKNERVNVYVRDAAGGTAAYSFVLDDQVHVRQFRRGRRADATVRVVVERSTIERIAGEYTQTRAVRSAYLDDEIEITGVGPGDWLQWRLIEGWVDHTLQR